MGFRALWGRGGWGPPGGCVAISIMGGCEGVAWCDGTIPDCMWAFGRQDRAEITVNRTTRQTHLPKACDWKQLAYSSCDLLGKQHVICSLSHPVIMLSHANGVRLDTANSGINHHIKLRLTADQPTLYKDHVSLSNLLSCCINEVITKAVRYLLSLNLVC